MANNITMNAGSGGKTLATDEVLAVQHQLVKLEFGAGGTAIKVCPTTPLPVEVFPPSTNFFDDLYQFMDTTGDGTGVIDVIGDYSAGTGTETAFKIRPTGTDVYHIERLIGTLEDGNNTITYDKYGGITALTNGILVRKYNHDTNTVLYDYTNAHPVESNADWASHCHDADIKIVGAGSDFAGFRWTFAQPICLDAANNEELQIWITDDLTGLTHQHFKVDGYKHTL